MKHFYTFGQAYGEGAYGTGTYSCTTEQLNAGQCENGVGTGTGTGSGGTGTGTGSLVDTGFAIVLAVTLACLLIFVALVVRFIRRPRTVAQEAVEAPSHDNDNFRF